MKVKFLSLNVWNGGLLFNKIISFIAQENPDIIALQEVNNSNNPSHASRFQTMTYIQEKLNYKHALFSPNAEMVWKQEGICCQYGNAIISHFPTQSSQTVFLIYLIKPLKVLGT